MARLRRKLKSNRSDGGKHEQTAEKLRKKYNPAGERWDVVCVTSVGEPRNHDIAGRNSSV